MKGGGAGLNVGWTGGESDFFMLTEQIRSIMQCEAFPSLLYVRDMSYGSDLLRRGGEGVGGVFGTMIMIIPRCLTSG